MRTEQILSYKELCAELQIEYKEHKARELQLNQLKDKYDIIFDFYKTQNYQNNLFI